MHPPADPTALEEPVGAAVGGRDIDALLDRMPSTSGTPRTVEDLPGGLTNRNLKVTTPASRIVVPLSANATSLLSIDRDNEHVNTVAAATVGVGPPVVDYLPGEGVLVVGYLDGRTFSDADLADPRNLTRVANAGRTLHGGPRFRDDFDMFTTQRRYLGIVRSHGFRLPPRYDEFAPAVERIREALAVRDDGTVPCNNDLLAENFIDDGDRIWIIDYEYYEYYELVTAYYARTLRNKIARARLLGLMSKYGWTLWASIQDGCSQQDFDFWSWGLEKYEGRCGVRRPGVREPAAGGPAGRLTPDRQGGQQTPRHHPDSSADERVLHKLGYAQVLFREMGGFSNFAISFTIISILAGCLTSYYIAFNNGGPVAITWGWLLVGAFCVLVALALGEIASSMPTAGALYYWASKLRGPAWGWFTGWFNLLGQIAVTASIDYGAAVFTTALLNIWFPALGTGPTTIFIVYTVIIALHLLLNLLGINLLAKLNSFSAWWHMIGVLVIVGVLIVVPSNHQSVAFVFTETINNSGFTNELGGFTFLFVFGLGLLMAQYTITGYDASAHMSEETQQASRAAAWGMVISVVMSVIFGFILLVAVTFAVPNVKGTLDAVGNAVAYIWTTSLGTGWAAFLLFIAVVAQLFCGAASVTSASRMMFAFSRDGAVPGWRIWRKVNNRRVPVSAVTAICVLAWALMLPTLANAFVGYLVGTSIAVIGLYIAFAIPIYLRLRQGDRFEHGAWSLGRHYRWIGVLALAWIIVVCILFLMPVSPKGIPGNPDFTWEVVNYAPLTVGGSLILFGGWYLLSAGRWFKGPVREAETEQELESIERSLQ